MLQLKNNNFKKKYIIKIPKDIQIIYCNEKNIIVFHKLFQKKVFKLEVKILLIPEKKLLIVTDIPVTAGKKKIKKLQGTTVASIKQQLIEMAYMLFTKLTLVGVGYRVFPYEKVSSQIYLKLGYSHWVYFKIPNNLSVSCYKSIKMFIYGNSSYQSLTQTASQIRACKIPEVYKGKGILYDQEKIVLKKGKKV